ncbi:MAG: hypothetical protein ACHQ0J_02320 [Candidatus Dormibacterales bacterium]
MSHSAIGAPPPGATAGFGIRTLSYLVDAFILSFVGGAFPYLVITTTNGGPATNGGRAFGGVLRGVER